MPQSPFQLSVRPTFRPTLLSHTIALLIALGGGFAAEQTIAPIAAHAYTARVDINLTVQPSETYTVLVRRAESVARAAAQRSFDRDILISQVAVVITAQNQGTVAPVLTLRTSRNQWRSRPDPRQWSIYFQSTKRLLGMDSAPTTVTPTASPIAVPTPQSPVSNPLATPTSATPQTLPLPTDNSSGGVPAIPTQIEITPNSIGRPQIIPDRIPTPGNIGK
jgi:hypothetical protein